VTYRRDVHDVRIVRIDEDACDVVSVTETHVLPSLTAVSRFEETGACIGTASHQHLAGSDPDNIGVGLRDGHRADGKCRFVFKDRLPRDAVIVRFPKIARADSDINGRCVAARTGNALDPSALKSRTRLPPFQVFEYRLVSELNVMFPGPHSSGRICRAILGIAMARLCKACQVRTYNHQATKGSLHSITPFKVKCQPVQGMGRQTSSTAT